MKNTKNIFVSILSAVAFFGASSVSASSAPTGSFDPVIELYNKNNESIQVNIIDLSSSGQKTIATAYPAADSQWNSGSRVIDMNSRLLIELLKQNKLIARFSINAPGKTKYLSIDLSKTPALYPQTGPLLGLMGKTKSGLPLKNNVSSSQITQMK
ncbi:MAG TPA: hypothetical protein VHX42_04480 [Candidatus Babeliales bacterium]|jgi:hypothetical protein|nr:hypothetical protein [Candidatus Babeliales bacterium]